MNEPTNLQWRVAEVQQKPQPHPGRRQVMLNLCKVCIAKPDVGLQFQQEVARTNEVRSIPCSDSTSLVVQRNLDFAFKRNSAVRELHFKRVAVRRFQQVGPEMGLDFDGRSDDPMGLRGGFLVEKPAHGSKTSART